MISIGALPQVGDFMRWIYFLIEGAFYFALQSTLLIAAGLILGRLFRRRGAAVQSVVYRTILVAILICPAVTVGLSRMDVQGWSFGSMVNGRWNWIDNSPTEGNAFDQVHAVEGGANERMLGDARLENREAQQIGLLATDSNRGRVQLGSNGSSIGFSEADNSTDQRGLLAILAVAVWIGVSSALLVRIARGYRSVARLRRQSVQADVATTQICNELASLLAVSSPVVRCSPFLSSPCLIGIRHPAIMLPEFTSQQTLRSVFIHELGHLKRRDLFWNMLCQLYSALFCFQPMLWWLTRKIDAAAEEACDDFVVRYGGDRQEYARQLVGIAELSVKPLAPACLGMVSTKSALARRVVRILDGSRRPAIRVGKSLHSAIVLFLMVITVGVVPIGLKSPVAKALAIDDSIHQAASRQDNAAIDRFGDSLPSEAKLRMGTVRFRSEAGIDSLAFSPDSKQLIGASSFDSSVRIWDVDTGREVKRLDLGAPTDAIVLAPVGTHVIVNRLQGISLLKLPNGEPVISKNVPHPNGSNFAMSIDGSVLVSQPWDQTLMIWDTDTSKGVRLLDLNKVAVGALQVSPSGLFIAMPTGKGSIRVFDVHAESVKVDLISKVKVGWEALAFPDDDTVLALGNVWTKVEGVGTQLSHIEERSLSDPSKSTVYEHPDGEIPGARNMVLSFDKTRLVTTHYDKIVVWDVDSKRPLKTISIPANGAKKIALSRDNRRLAFAGNGCKPTLWNLETDREEHAQSDSHHDVILSLNACDEKRLLVTASRDGKTLLWNSITGDYLRTLDQDEGWTRDVHFFSDGMRVALCGEVWGDSTVRGRVAIVETESGKRIRQWDLSGSAVALDLSPNETLLAVGICGSKDDPFQGGNSDPQIEIWDLREHKRVAHLKNVTGSTLSEIQFTDEATIRFTTDYGAFVWNRMQPKPEPIDLPKKRSFKDKYALGGQRLLAVSYDRDGRTQVTTCTMRMLDCVNRNVIWKQDVSGEEIRSIAISPDGRLAAAFRCSSKESKLIVMRVDTGKPMRTYELGTHSIHKLAFSKDGRTLFSGMGQGDILCWDVSFAHATLQENKP